MDRQALKLYRKELTLYVRKVEAFVRDTVNPVLMQLIRTDKVSPRLQELIGLRYHLLNTCEYLTAEDTDVNELPGLVDVALELFKKITVAIDAV